MVTKHDVLSFAGLDDDSTSEVHADLMELTVVEILEILFDYNTNN